MLFPAPFVLFCIQNRKLQLFTDAFFLHYSSYSTFKTEKSSFSPMLFPAPFVLFYAQDRKLQLIHTVSFPAPFILILHSKPKTPAYPHGIFSRSICPYFAFKTEISSLSPMPFSRTICSYFTPKTENSSFSTLYPVSFSLLESGACPPMNTLAVPSAI